MAFIFLESFLRCEDFFIEGGETLYLLPRSPSLLQRSTSTPVRSRGGVCQRSSRSLARQRRTACSSAGGVIGLIVLIGGGSFSRIAEARLRARLPSKGPPRGHEW